jgi:hypothetical protein
MCHFGGEVHPYGEPRALAHNFAEPSAGSTAQVEHALAGRVRKKAIQLAPL